MNEQFETVQKLCPQCSKAVDTDARFCKHCAFDLSNAGVNRDVSAETNQSRPKRHIIGIVGALCLLIFGLIGVAIKITGEKTNQQSAENVNFVSQAPDSTLTLGEKARQIEEKILRGEALNADDLEGLSPQELRILRNVHFARYGRKYERPGLGDYFFARSWYKPNDSFNDSMLTSTDKENLKVILSVEKSEVVASTPIYSATPEQIQNSYEVHSEIPSTPGETSLAYLQSVDSGNFDYYLKYSKATTAVLYPICPKMETARMGRLPEDSEILEDFNTLRNQIKRLRRNEVNVKSRKIISENINGDEAEVVLATEYVNGQTSNKTNKYRKLGGIWIDVGVIALCMDWSKKQ